MGGALRRSSAEPRGPLSDQATNIQISIYLSQSAGRVLAARIWGDFYTMQSSSEPWMARTNNALLVSLTPILVHAETIFEYGFALPGAIRAL